MRWFCWELALIGICFLVVACDRGGEVGPSPEVDKRSGPAEAQVTDVPVATLPRVVFLGDSLTAGLGLPEAHVYPARLAEMFAATGNPISVVNAGVSGDTTAGGWNRLEWVLAQNPDLLVIELGANDGLRGFDPETTESNLRRILERIRAGDTAALLIGMRLPPSYGGAYVGEFEGIYPRLAAEFGIPLVPFLLEGVAARPELNLPDGIHPNAEGHLRMARTVYPYVEAILFQGDSEER